MSIRYKMSEDLLERAFSTIPLGAQTFSKSITQYPYEVSPYFITRGLGSRVWDVDGNEYIDFINAQASITLGYNDPDIKQAVVNQLESGSIFSLSHPIEVEVAEKIVEMVPCAEMVRFGKNGSDATAGAIRLSRAYTGRDYVAVCGYHGWQDWYIGSTTRNLGVPKATQELTLKFQYNNLASLEQLFLEYPNQIAAVILEPMNVEYPVEGFLDGVREITSRNNAVLIFDETITGFRYATGGAQQLFNVIPDLATFGKGLANGFPVSAVAGRSDIMKLMEEVFFSFTFGGETLSLAASLATMNKLQTKSVIPAMIATGTKILEETQRLIHKHSINNLLATSGHPTWSFLLFRDTNQYNQWEIKTLFLQEMFARGILTYGSHNISFAHTEEDVEKLLAAYDEVFFLIKKAVETHTLNEILRTPPLKPLFKVR